MNPPTPPADGTPQSPPPAKPLTPGEQAIGIGCGSILMIPFIICLGILFFIMYLLLR